ncbi:hypothetical protein MDA_GLEAN10009265 [Myotis davidii]|uniref:Uncharacterized protein n=1 Tax=Myotis davidii TaxID=225400 RepID=L5LCI9_MYODS|nr:hypothetical protein MDA_GLEAN10009265 [Myotis davidii]
MNSCISGVPRPGLQDQAETGSQTSLEWSRIARSHGPEPATPLGWRRRHQHAVLQHTPSQHCCLDDNLQVL